MTVQPPPPPPEWSGRETEEERHAKAIAFLRICGFTSTTCCRCGKQVDPRFERLLQCARCHIAHYCSLLCVQRDFEAHRPVCLLVEEFGPPPPPDPPTPPPETKKTVTSDPEALLRRRPKRTQSLDPAAVSNDPPLRSAVTTCTSPLRKTKSLYNPKPQQKNDGDSDHANNDNAATDPLVPSLQSKPSRTAKVKRSKSGIRDDYHTNDLTTTTAAAAPQPSTTPIVKVKKLKKKNNDIDGDDNGSNENNNNHLQQPSSSSSSSSEKPPKDPSADDPPSTSSTTKKVRRPLLKSHKSCDALDGGGGRSKSSSLHHPAAVRPKLRRNKSVEENGGGGDGGGPSSSLSSMPTAPPPPAKTTTTPAEESLSTTPTSANNNDDDDNGTPTTTTAAAKKKVRKPPQSHKSLDDLDGGGRSLHATPTTSKPPSSRPKLKRNKSADDGKLPLKPKRIDLDLQGLPKRVGSPDDDDPAKRRERNHLSGGRLVIVTEGDVQQGVRQLLANDGQCCYCGKHVPKHLMLQCARCKVAYYCKMDCLQDDFSQQHRPLCNFIVEYKDYATIVAVERGPSTTTTSR
jgi:MYND finger